MTRPSLCYCGEPVGVGFRLFCSESCKALRRSSANRERLRAMRVHSPEVLRAYKRKSYRANKAKAIAASARWRRKNPDKARAISRRYAEDHHDRVIKTRAKYNESQKYAAKRLRYLNSPKGRAKALELQEKRKVRRHYCCLWCGAAGVAGVRKRYCSRKCAQYGYWSENQGKRRDIAWRYSVRKRFGGTLPDAWLVEALGLVRRLKTENANR